MRWKRGGRMRDRGTTCPASNRGRYAVCLDRLGPCVGASLAAACNVNALATCRLATARTLEANVLRRYTVGELSRIDAHVAQTDVLAASAEQAETATTLLQEEHALRTLTAM